MRVPGSDSYYKLMVTSRQTGAAPLTPRTGPACAGTCAGSLVFDDKTLKAISASSCSRLLDHHHHQRQRKSGRES